MTILKTPVIVAVSCSAETVERKEHSPSSCMELLDCCPDWPVQIEKVDGPIVLQSLRAGRDLYDGIPFRYCPWCGKKRPEEEKQSTEKS